MQSGRVKGAVMMLAKESRTRRIFCDSFSFNCLIGKPGESNQRWIIDRPRTCNEPFSAKAFHYLAFKHKLTLQIRRKRDEQNSRSMTTQKLLAHPPMDTRDLFHFFIKASVAIRNLLLAPFFKRLTRLCIISVQFGSLFATHFGFLTLCGMMIKQIRPDSWARVEIKSEIKEENCVWKALEHPFHHHHPSTSSPLPTAGSTQKKIVRSDVIMNVNMVHVCSLINYDAKALSFIDSLSGVVSSCSKHTQEKLQRTTISH